MYIEEYMNFCIVRGSFWGLSLYAFSWKMYTQIYLSLFLFCEHLNIQREYAFQCLK